MRSPGQQKPAADNHTDRRPEQPEAVYPSTSIKVDDAPRHSTGAGDAKEHGPWQKEPEWWVAIWTFALFVSTTGLWFFTALLWKATRRAVMEGQEAISA